MHSLELTLLLFTKVGFLKPIQTTETLKSADLKVSQPELLSKHSAVSSRDGQKQRQNAEYLCDMKAPSAHCIFAIG